MDCTNYAARKKVLINRAADLGLCFHICRKQVFLIRDKFTYFSIKDVGECPQHVYGEQTHLLNELFHEKTCFLQM